MNKMNIFKSVVGMLICSFPFSSLTAGEVLESPTSSPEYAIAPCCSLCPTIKDATAYVSEYARGFRIIEEGLNGYLFRTEAELIFHEPEDPDVWISMKRFVDALRARGVTVLIYPQPPRGLIESRKLDPSTRERFDVEELRRKYEDFVSTLRQTGFFVADGAVFADLQDAEYFYKRDGHWKTSGSHMAAKFIAEQVRKMGFEFPRKEYVSQQIGLIGSPETTSDVVEALCGTRYPMEFTPKFETKAPESSDLFGDEALPSVTLLGTSFSASPTYSFLGFLREELKTDIFQAAMSGGAFDGAASQYFVSEAFKTSPPKLIIWEVPYQHLMRTTTDVMRRMIPLVEDGCASRPILLESKSKLESANEFTEVISNGGQKFVSTPAKDLWIDLKFSDPNIRQIKVEIWYANGKSQIINSRYNQYTSMDGRFVLETNHGPETESQPIVSIRTLSVTETNPGTSVAAKVCESKRL